MRTAREGGRGKYVHGLVMRGPMLVVMAPAWLLADQCACVRTGRRDDDDLYLNHVYVCHDDDCVMRPESNTLGCC